MCLFFFFKHKTSYEMRISDWSSDVCSSDLDRERFVIATKYANAAPGRSDPNEAGMHRKSPTRALDASLQRLGLDYIDLYYVHWWDFTTPVEEVQRALDAAVSAGKILHIGLSDVPAWVVSRAQAFHDLRGLAPFSCIQLEYHRMQHYIERENLPPATPPQQ